MPAASNGAEVFFVWPRRYVVSGFILGVRSAVAVELANTRLRIVDDSSTELFSDGRGLTVSGSSVALVGLRPRFMAFRRPVRPGEKWLFQIINGNGGVAVVPSLLFRVEVSP